MGRNIEIAVKIALDGFLDLAARREGIDAGDQIESVLEARLRSSAGARPAAAGAWTRSPAPTGSAPGWPGAR